MRRKDTIHLKFKNNSAMRRAPNNKFATLSHFCKKNLAHRLAACEEEVFVAFGERSQGGQIGEHRQHVVGDLGRREPMGEVAILEQARQMSASVVVWL